MKINGWQFNVHQSTTLYIIVNSFIHEKLICLHNFQNEIRFYVKGSIEQILRISTRYAHHSGVAHLTEDRAREFHSDSNQMAAKGLRGRSNKDLPDFNDRFKLFQFWQWRWAHRWKI